MNVIDLLATMTMGGDSWALCFFKAWEAPPRGGGSLGLIPIPTSSLISCFCPAAPGSLLFPKARLHHSPPPGAATSLSIFLAGSGTPGLTPSSFAICAGEGEVLWVSNWAGGVTVVPFLEMEHQGGAGPGTGQGGWTGCWDMLG